MDPIMVNPCSYASLVTVLDNIITKCYREWIVIGCDGLPYILCSRIIDNYYVCPTCHELFKKKESFFNQVIVHPVDETDECIKYDKVLLLP